MPKFLEKIIKALHVHSWSYVKVETQTRNNNGRFGKKSSIHYRECTNPNCKKFQRQTSFGWMDIVK